MASSPRKRRLVDDDRNAVPVIDLEATASESQSRGAFSAASRSSSRKRRMMLRLDRTGVETRSLAVDTVPDAARDLVKSIRRIGRALDIIPHSAMASAVEHAKARNLDLDEWTYSFQSADVAEEALPGRLPIFEEVDKIRNKAAQCDQLRDEEASWNHQVHMRLLESIFEQSLGGQCDEFNAMICKTARPDPEFLPGACTAKMVDLCVYTTRYEGDSNLADTVTDFRLASPTVTINHSDFEPTGSRPILLSIETKKPGVQGDLAKLQIGVWHAAQWNFLRWAVGERILRQRAADSSAPPLEGDALEDQKLAALKTLGFIPGIIIQGHEWYLVLSTYDKGRTTLRSNVKFGSTQTCLETYAAVAGVRKLTAWARDSFLPWFEANVL